MKLHENDSHHIRSASQMNISNRLILLIIG